MPRKRKERKGCRCFHFLGFLIEARLGREESTPYPEGAGLAGTETRDKGVLPLPLAVVRREGCSQFKMTADMGIFRPPVGARRCRRRRRRQPRKPGLSRLSMPGRPSSNVNFSLTGMSCTTDCCSFRTPPPRERLPLSAGQEQRGKSAAGTVEALQAGPSFPPQHLYGHPPTERTLQQSSYHRPAGPSLREEQEDTVHTHPTLPCLGSPGYAPWVRK